MRSIYLLIKVAIKGIPSSRAAASLVAVIGFAGVTIVILGILSLRNDVQRMYLYAGRDDVAVILSGNWESTSFIGRNTLLRVADLPGIKRGAAGSPLPLSPEIVSLTVQLPSSDAELSGPFVLGRGVTATAAAFRPKFHLTAGRDVIPGRYEAIVGQALVQEYPYIKIGSEIRVRTAWLTIVGMFSCQTRASEFEVWIDKSTLQSILAAGSTAQGRTPDYSSEVLAQLSTKDDLSRLNASLARDPSNLRASSYNQLRATSERAFLEFQSQGIVNQLSKLVVIMAFTLGIAAASGSVNTMYAAISARAREIAILRAIGFGSYSIVVSIAAEALALSLVGATLGTVLGMLFLHRIRVPSFNIATNPAVSFGFDTTPVTVAVNVSYCALLAVLSCLLPCIRAIKTPIPRGIVAS